ncbi:hypothetical protein A3F03_02420 [Candidatus Roizmanbacteria bacterium RIFCSPHIGHO2_12_FULL_41_11]|uniref:PEGA domain-containing protein n=1 Tax=Candidatus Roizmanbacteria bacterium RIFCSPHIGHO2_12_FULL_41_11 TaxID=1802052 RepID=A0A1F7I3Z4_9BACT|nr:MAG: hypothetical protein A3F03_02420 [Candidatus Roizmanbacteria bacterium RIFCSPHIGHO2_12_FULL_41_11]
MVLLLVIAFARGYRFDLINKKFTSTGILAVSSSPKPAKVYINGEFKGVTDLNLTLPYGKYEVEIKKEGYSELKKTITIKGEVVFSINTLLFPKNPSLSPLTNLGIVKAIGVKDTNQTILISDTNNAQSDGLYLFEPSRQPFSLFPPLKTIILKSALPSDIDLKLTDVYFSADNKQGIFTFHFTDDAQSPISYVMSLSDAPEPLDVSLSRDNMMSIWHEQKMKNDLKVLETFPKKIRQIAVDAFQIIAFSPDETKMFYQAKHEASLLPIISPPVIGSNQTLEERLLQANKFYVYDKKEDKNFRINFSLETELIKMQQTIDLLTDSEATQSAELVNSYKESILALVKWYPDSEHLVIKNGKEINIVDYDGTNKISVYSGPFDGDFFTISSDWNLVIMANLNPQTNPASDLYEVGIR